MPVTISNKLTAKTVSNLRLPGTYADGGGLYIRVRPGSDPAHPFTKAWVYRYTKGGRVRELGLGPVRDLPLVEARDLKNDLNRRRRLGEDPAETRRLDKLAARLVAATVAEAEARTFRFVAAEFIAENRAGWSNPKHVAQWVATLEAYAYPVIGDLPVDKVTRDHVLAILRPIWTEKAETASRLRGRIEKVLAYATARDWRQGPNPAAWKGHLDAILPSKRVKAVEHHAAMPFAEAPAFMLKLAGMPGVGPRALEFAILTAARTGEVLGARWSEIDREAATWTVPAERMKAKREHRVPLSPAALALLDKLPSTGNDLLFPGERKGKVLSNVVMLAVLRRMGVDVTTHGFRSTFRDWAGDATAFPREVAETCLAHTLKDKVEAAYRRGDALEKRRALLDAWAAFLTEGVR